MAVRNVDSGMRVKEEILKGIPKARLTVMEIDLNSLASVRRFATEYIASGLPLNILINNAGVMAPPFTLSKDNIEQQFAVNHLGPFLLTNLLLETMKSTACKAQKEGRIVNVSSTLHQNEYKEGIHFDKINDKASYNGNAAYGQSKLCNLLHTNELARRFKREGVNITANSLHHGIIATNITNNLGLMGWVINTFGKYLLKNVPQVVGVMDFGLAKVADLMFKYVITQAVNPESHISFSEEINQDSGHVTKVVLKMVPYFDPELQSCGKRCITMQVMQI